MRDWSKVPQELLGLIAERLNSIEDYVRFGGVCRSWRSANVDQRGYYFSPKTLPWLMFPRQKNTNEYDGSGIGTPNFFSLSENKFYNINMPKNTISTRKLFFDCYLSGSPYGWLITFSGTKVEIFNPLSRAYLPLPSLSTFKDYSCSLLIKKAVLGLPSSHSAMRPAEDHFVALVSLTRDRDRNGKFAFARPRDKAWTTVKIPNTIVHDILSFNNQFYVVDRKGVVKQFDIASPTPSATEFVLPPVDVDTGYINCYLVELLGELHMVVKYASFGQLIMTHHFEPGSRPFADSDMFYFRVFQLDFYRREWKEVFTLGDYAIFVGRSVSFSLLVENYPNCKTSSIYFADDWLGDALHIGVFNLETKGLKTLFTGNDVPSLYAAPVWFIPNLY